MQSVCTNELLPAVFDPLLLNCPTLTGHYDTAAYLTTLIQPGIELLQLLHRYDALIPIFSSLVKLVRHNRLLQAPLQLADSLLEMQDFGMVAKSFFKGFLMCNRLWRASRQTL